MMPIQVLRLRNPSGSSGPLGPIGPFEVLRLQFIGPNGGTTYTDDTSFNHVVTGSGTAAISTANFYIGNSSLLLPGNDASRLIVTTQGTEFQMSNLDFEYKGAFWPTSLTGTHVLFTNRAPSGSDPGVYIITSGAQFNFMFWGPSSGITAFSQTGGTLVLNAWNTFDVKRVSGTITIIVNGVTTFNSSGSGASTTMATSPYNAYISADPSTTGRWFGGNIGYLQVAKGGLL